VQPVLRGGADEEVFDLAEPEHHDPGEPAGDLREAVGEPVAINGNR